MYNCLQRMEHSIFAKCETTLTARNNDEIRMDYLIFASTVSIIFVQLDQTGMIGGYPESRCVHYVFQPLKIQILIFNFCVCTVFWIFDFIFRKGGLFVKVEICLIRMVLDTFNHRLIFHFSIKLCMRLLTKSLHLNFVSH